MKLSAAAVSVAGKVRRQNQDNLFMGNETRPTDQRDYCRAWTSGEQTQIYSVCDGMGGEQAGEEASYRAVAVLAEEASGHNADWSACIAQANESVCGLCRERGIRAGSTFSAVFFIGEECTAVNVGDSRIYYITKNKIRQVSLDHTRFQTMVGAGLIEKNDRKHDKARSELTQYLGIEGEQMELEPYVEHLKELRPGDMILLCSDGLYGSVEDDELLALSEEHESLLECCTAMVRRAEENGSRDNITAMLIRIEPERKRRAFGRDWLKMLPWGK